MGNILNIGARALLSNQLALQTAGNNIANVNTPGYSRQSVLLQSVDGQFSGSGYYGNGVDAATVLRNHDEFLTRQAILSGSIAAADNKRLEQLRQLEDQFQGGPNGLGAAVSDLLNAFSDVVSAPTDLSARTVVLGRADEMAARFRSTASSLASIQQGVKIEFTDLARAPLLEISFVTLDAIKKQSGRDLFAEALKAGRSFDMFDKVNGTTATRKILQAAGPAAVVKGWKPGEEEFRKQRKKYLLY